MSFLRTARQPILRPLSRTTPRYAFAGRRFASQDYGSPEGDMVKESPKDRGKNPSEHIEHPGPPPPSTGNKGQSSQSSGSSGVGGKSTDASSQQQSSGKSKGTQDAQPKILNTSPPQDENAPEDVQKHNQELEQRAEKANEKVKDEDIEKDKVSKDFWRGMHVTIAKMSNLLISNYRPWRSGQAAIKSRQHTEDKLHTSLVEHCTSPASQAS
jgi:hypothetical protein